MTARALVLAAVAVSLVSCRDGVGVYELDSDPLTGPARQLTFNDHAEYAPSWSARSDSVYFSTGDFTSYRGFARTLLRVSIEGGRADPLAPGAQSQGAPAPQPPLAAPVLSRDGARLAYVQLFCHDVAREQGDSPYNCVNAGAVLDSAMVRVRQASASGAAHGDPAITIRSGTLDALTFRPSWSPDGTRVTFADGSAVHVWQPDNGAVTPVPGTAGAVSAAWHPAASEIAFVSDGMVRVVNVASGALRQVAPGAEPAWSPDGSMIYLRSGGRIMRVPSGGGAAQEVANTVGGRSPAVSPDGRWVAFTRTKNVFGSTDWDVWVVRLD